MLKQLEWLTYENCMYLIEDKTVLGTVAKTSNGSYIWIEFVTGRDLDGASQTMALAASEIMAHVLTRS